MDECKPLARGSVLRPRLSRLVCRSDAVADAVADASAAAAAIHDSRRAPVGGGKRGGGVDDRVFV